MHPSGWFAALALMGFTAASAEANDDPRSIAMTYLQATTGEGDERGKELLLGGVTMDAQLYSLENGRIVSEDPVRRESGDLASAKKLLRDLDRSGKDSIDKMSGSSVGDDLEVRELTQQEAAKILAPTRLKAQKLTSKHPVLAYALRVGKEVFWHPKNPMRPVLANTHSNGKYSIEVHRFVVESLEGPRRAQRTWGLKVIRFRSGSLDTGWKILPASDWSVE
jgi:hypothetical protein